MDYKGGVTLAKLPDKLRDRQIKFLGHIVRSDLNDPVRTSTITEDGSRAKAGFKRVGRPRLKWYDMVIENIKI